MKNILAIVPALIPSVNITIVNPMEYLHKKGQINFKIILCHLFTPQMLENIDCVLFCRNAFFTEEWILNEVINKKIPYIYEIDDNLFEISYDNELGKVHRNPFNISSLINFIKYASIVRTYSKLLAEDITVYNKKVEINRVYFNLELIEGLKQNKSNKLKIIYATSRIEDSQQNIFNQALRNIAKTYLSRVEVYFWGAPIVDDELKELDNVFYLAPIHNYEEFIQKFYEMGFDIGLAPIFGGRFFNSKTNNKYREYAACNIAGIYSNEDLYKSCIINDENGILVNNTSLDWYKAIEKLILNDALRVKIIENANKDISLNYTFESYYKKWMNSINEAISISTKNKNINSFFQKNAYIECFVLEDLNFDDEISVEFKDNFFNYLCQIGLINIIKHDVISYENISKYDSKYLKKQRNIILLSNEKFWIEHFNEMFNNNKNIVLLTKLDEENCKIFDKLNFISFSNKNLNIYENYCNNVYIKIIYEIKKNFYQTKEKEFIMKIKNNFFYRKVRAIPRYSKFFLFKLYKEILLSFDNGDIYQDKILLNNINSKMTKNSLIIFSHYDKDNIIDDYVVHYLTELKKLECDILFVSTSEKMLELEANKISSLCCQVIVKQNIGYDFGAWRTGIEIMSDKLRQYEQLILCNDSVYAPLFDLNEMFKQMDRKFDFWGITDNYQHKHHIQSYFMVFSRKVFLEKYFLDFWKNIKVFKHKESIVRNYEIGLTKLIRSKKYTYGAYCPSSFGDKKNSTHYYWKKLILEQKAPIIKIELLRDNPTKTDISDWENILLNNKFDINMIKNHLKRIKKSK